MASSLSSLACPARGCCFCLTRCKMDHTADFRLRNVKSYYKTAKNSTAGLPISSYSSWNGSLNRKSKNLSAFSLSQGQENSQLRLKEASEEEQSARSQPQDVELFGSSEDEDTECVRQIQQVLQLLKEKRDMSFNEVRLTIMIEDPREAEVKRQLAQEGRQVVTREEMADALVDVHEGRMPSDKIVLRELAKEMTNWPKLETEVDEKKSSSLSPYAQVTDTGVDPKVAAQRAKIDWDAAAEINPEDVTRTDDSPPPAVGFSLLYFITALPIVIVVAVIIILFVNSLQ
eukprot:TRINITY_DN19910_c0_g4_i1.p1 TRINITY_DN19910_c0_g4~~TRINITY_DN19910_c0_g4_i1.p1  ORF type:complete len:287 (-),score=61.89 TRINITY_DN19910_c0_g4_i1:558-1418(-)